jgi:hypothetical protein
MDPKVKLFELPCTYTSWHAAVGAHLGRSTNYIHDGEAYSSFWKNAPKDIQRLSSRNNRERDTLFAFRPLESLKGARFAPTLFLTWRSPGEELAELILKHTSLSYLMPDRYLEEYHKHIPKSQSEEDWDNRNVLYSM